MTFSEFEKQYKEIMNKAFEVAKYKQEHYGQADNVFKSFEELDDILKQGVENIMFVLFSKHIVSLKKILNSPEDIDLLEEKIVDLINYLILIHAYLMIKK